MSPQHACCVHTESTVPILLYFSTLYLRYGLQIISYQSHLLAAPGERRNPPLHLQPYDRTSGHHIKCTIKHAKLSDKTHYEALLYRWGLPIMLDIEVNSKFVPVTENLWQALFHLTTSKTIRIMWIDGICIKQTDKSERNRQVSQMSRIYRRADRVISWLGMPDWSSHLAMQILNKEFGDSTWSIATTESVDKTVRIADDVEIPYTSQVTADKQPSLQCQLQAVACFCWRPYWLRLWIIQEIIMGPDIVLLCGHDQVTWSDFYQFVDDAAKLTNLDQSKHLAGTVLILQDSIPSRLGLEINLHCGVAGNHMRLSMPTTCANTVANH